MKHKDRTKPLRKGFLYIILLLLITGLHSYGQNISGVVNSYYEVTGVYTTYVQMDMNENLSTLHVGDKVVLMQMTGVEMTNVNFPTQTQGIANFGPNQSAGRYEMLSVKSVNDVSKQVEFTVNLDPSSDYSTVEKFQLIKIYEADYATVSGTLTAAEWNDSTGGVLALVIYKKLTLNANIDVSKKGFLGGLTEQYSIDKCKEILGGGQDTFYFHSSALNKAGKKGEGNIKKSWEYTKGPGRVVTGGGGGFGYYAGGGGGGHYGAGGQGGRQRQLCDNGMWANPGTYLNSSNNYYGYDRVTMGGGGGSSTQYSPYSATKGGDGGGIVILLVDTLDGNNYTIFNTGESVSVPATAGGGGGGAGGSVLLDVNVYSDLLKVDVSGGKGGDVDSYTGAGGGGGGGVIWYAGSSISSSVTQTYAGGARGIADSSNYYGYAGQPGGQLGSLSLPLNGFLFNSINGEDIICAGQQPDTITGSQPKGGTGSYTYSWWQKTESGSWVAAAGTGGLLYFQPNALNETMYFRRLVTSGAVTDTSLPVQVFVYPAISGNSLSIRDTLCSGDIDSPGTLTGGAVTGGNNSNYEYQWEYTTNQAGAWSPGATTSSMNVVNLTQTTYYRRIVTSAVVCSSTSNIDTLTIIPQISNNGFSAESALDTAICSGLPEGTIYGDQPSGGDGIYSYQWTGSNDNISYSGIGGAISKNYSPPALSDGDYYYKRVVYSGEGNACQHTSEAYFIKVYPSISGNNLSTDQSLYCYGNTIHPITGAQPDGGQQGNYTYRWYNRQPGDTWTLINNQEGISYSPPSGFYDTTQIRRDVVSGDYDACINSSNVIQIDVIPEINNNLISPDTTLCEGQSPDPFTEPPATGGAGGFVYLWQTRPPSGAWVDATGINNAASYNAGSLSGSAEFRRRVQSQICTSDGSGTIMVTVYPSITNNFIGGAVQYSCFNSEKEITGRMVGGGNPGDIRYSWEQSLNGSDWNAAGGSNTSISYTTSPLIDTAYYRRIVMSGQYNQCIDTSAQALIRINPLPTGDILSSIDTVCAGSDLIVNYSGLTGNGPWSIVMGDDTDWYTEEGITSGSGQFSFPVTESGQLHMRSLIDDSLCQADLTGNTGIIDLTVYRVPVANAGIDSSICDLTTTLAAIPSIGEGYWTGYGVTFTNPWSAQSQVTADSYGTYTLEWTEINWQCDSTDDVIITFDEQPDSANAGENQLLDYTFSTTLDADPPDVGSGYWQFVQGEGDFVDSTVNNTEVSFDYPNVGDYVLLWTVVNGICPALTSTVTITIGDVDLKYHGFSPNYDDINETFYINLSGLTDCELIIFDRRGNEVIRIPAPRGENIVSWDGLNSDRKEMPAGTYYFILKRTGLDDKKGYIELRK